MCYRVDGFSLQEDVQAGLLIVDVEKELVAEYFRQGIRKWVDGVFVVTHMVAFELHNARLIVGILVGVDRNRQEGLYPDFFSYSADKFGKLYHSITQSWPVNLNCHGCFILWVELCVDINVDSMLLLLSPVGAPDLSGITNLIPNDKHG